MTLVLYRSLAKQFAKETNEAERHGLIFPSEARCIHLALNNVLDESRDAERGGEPQRPDAAAMGGDERISPSLSATNVLPRRR